MRKRGRKKVGKKGARSHFTIISTSLRTHQKLPTVNKYLSYMHCNVRIVYTKKKGKRFFVTSEKKRKNKGRRSPKISAEDEGTTIFWKGLFSLFSVVSHAHDRINTFVFFGSVIMVSLEVGTLPLSQVPVLCFGGFLLCFVRAREATQRAKTLGRFHRRDN